MVGQPAVRGAQLVSACKAERGRGISWLIFGFVIRPGIPPHLVVVNMSIFFWKIQSLVFFFTDSESPYLENNENYSNKQNTMVNFNITVNLTSWSTQTSWSNQHHDQLQHHGRIMKAIPTNKTNFIYPVRMKLKKKK